MAESAASTTGAVPALARAPLPAGVFLRQLFDRESCTYSYLLADEDSRDAVLIDAVDTCAPRDAALVAELGLHLTHVLDTHAHADHITGAHALKALIPGLQSVISKASGAVADVLVEHGDSVTFGGHTLTVRATPGHTPGCVTYVLGEAAAFTGDALFVRGCGRTDFQGGSAETLYDSVHGQIFSLPAAAVVYPGHDYKGRLDSTVGEEQALNPRLTQDKAGFVATMAALGLPEPKLIHIAVPANLRGGAPAPAPAA